MTNADREHATAELRDLHDVERRLDVAFEALNHVGPGVFVHCRSAQGTDVLPTGLASLVRAGRHAPAGLHPLSVVEATDHGVAHQAWMRACHGDDRVGRATISTTVALAGEDGLPPAAAGRFRLTIVDLVGTEGVDAVVILLEPIGSVPEDRPTDGADGSSLYFRLDGDGWIRGASGACAGLLDLSPDDLIGTHMAEHVHPDDVLSASAAWLELLEQPERPQQHRLRARRADTTWRWMLATSWNELANPIEQVVIIELRDIQSLVEIEQAQAAADLGFRALAESLPVGIVVLDDEGRVHFSNERLVAILTEADVFQIDTVGRGLPDGPPGTAYVARWTEVVPDWFASEIAPIVMSSEASGDEPAIGHVRAPGTDGRARHIRVKARTIHRPGGRNFIVSFSDVTEEITAAHAHDRLVAVVDELDEAVFVGSADGSVSYLNQAARQFLGPGELESGVLSSLRPDLLQHIEDEIAPAVQELRPWSGDLDIADVDGRMRTMATSISPVVDPDRSEVHFGVRLRDVTAERAHERELAHQARHDQLSGLPNRLALMEQLQEMATESALTDDIVLCFIDIDNLKIVNDGLGHDAGDRLLAVVADELRAAAPNDVVARFGGDEFVVVSDRLGPAEAMAFAARLLAAVERAEVQGVASHVSASIGVARTARVDLVPSDLVRQADAAMYAAKRAGRGRCAVFDEDLRDQVNRRFSLESDLRRTLMAEGLDLHLQPVVNLQTHMVTGFEALARWSEASPAEFIPVAEDSGLIVALGRSVLRRALADTMSLRADVASLADTQIGVNVSARELYERDFAVGFLDAVAESGTPPQSILIELTESILLHPGEHVDRTLDQLRSAGVRLALDDFGTGYSSLNYLRRYPIDILKFDVGYTQALTEDPETRVIVEAIVSMASRLGIGVVAEGIETPEHLEVVRDLGVGWAQGYLLGRPASVTDLLAGGIGNGPLDFG